MTHTRRWWPAALVLVSLAALAAHGLWLPAARAADPAVVHAVYFYSPT